MAYTFFEYLFNISEYLRVRLEAFGAFGTFFGLKYRHPLYMLALCCSILSIVLCTVSTVGASSNGHTVMCVPWASAIVTNVRIDGSEVTDFDVFCGATTMVVYIERESSTSKWGQVECTSPKYCDAYQSCRSVVPSIISALFFHYLTVVPALFLMHIRSDLSSDHYYLKGLSVATATVSVLTLAAVIIEFSVGCHHHLISEDKFSIMLDGYSVEGDASYVFGQGYICMLVALLLDVPALLVNLLVPSSKGTVSHNTFHYQLL